MGTKEYIEWIDIAKGIGILLVIAGHTICLKISSPLYAFHMPLFFLLSGLVYNNDKYSKASAFFPTKTKQILKPWAIMWTISLLVCLIIPEWKEALSFKEIIKEFYTTNHYCPVKNGNWSLK
jgi:acyltransferase